MSVKLTITMDGFTEVQRDLADWARRIDDWKPAFDKIAQDWRETARRTFDSEGAVDGLPRWAELAESTKAQKRKAGYPEQILVRTGKLRAATINPRTSIGKRKMTLQVASDYGIYHQSRRPRKRLPRRPFITVGEGRQARQADRWLEILAKHAEPRP